MKASELMIGDFVIFHEQIVEIAGIDKYSFQIVLNDGELYCSPDFEKIDYIKISGDILLSLGFTFSPYSSSFFIMDAKNQYVLCIRKDNGVIVLFQGVELFSINYVHELQHIHNFFIKEKLQLKP